ncbi:unnamed protein product [Pleuronectes platessa]|uniref:Uncharacterized protein n=1 Tax=Pleuronectes platessa TaxID=8262 RepID=A0A9N7UQC0_PLEPL|nr:unnamed protein product [Pleuronectes platessa]
MTQSLLITPRLAESSRSAGKRRHCTCPYYDLLRPTMSQSRQRRKRERLIEAGQMTWIHPSTARSSPTCVPHFK